MPDRTDNPGNPFRYGHIATGEHFTDRARELHTLVADLSAGQSVVIISPRRYGKTSLALQAREQLEHEQVLVAYADLFRATSKRRLIDELGTALYRGLASPLDRARAAAVDIFRALPLQPKISATRDGGPSIEFSPLALPEDQDRALTQLLEIPERFASERGRRVVVMLDEFQEVVSLDPALPGMLRATIQAQQHVAYVFLGSRQHLMTRVFTDRNEPLYRSARPLPLGPIGTADFGQFIRSRFASTGVLIEAAAIVRILDIAEGHPHDTQELCHFTWDLGKNSGAVVTAERVDDALSRVVEAEDAHYTTLWESLARAQRALVLAVAQEPTQGLFGEAFRQRHQLGSAATVQRALGAVLERDVVEGSSVHGYRVPDVFFRAWLAHTLGD
jgi:hypothetical protein